MTGVYLLFFLIGLESKLVSECELEYGVLAVKTIDHLANSPVVTGIDDEIRELIGHTYGDGEVEAVHFHIFIKQLVINGNTVVLIFPCGEKS